MMRSRDEYPGGNRGDVAKPGMTRFQLHLEHWKRGCDSTQCPGARRVVLYRGKVPCDVLFVGEAPGKSENTFGVPFKGPAGHLLDHIILKALPPSARYGITNIVGCIPRNPDRFARDQKEVQPDDEQVHCCTPRFQEIVEIADPKLLVCLGTFSTGWLDTRYSRCIKLHKPIPRCSLDHPAYIQRMDAVRKSQAIREAIVALTDAFEREVVPF